MTNLTLVVTQLQVQRNAIEAQLSKINSAVEALKGMRRSGTGRTASAGPRRVMSASARRRIAAAQRSRWAKWRSMKNRKAA
jgi:hypothetical protein